MTKNFLKTWQHAGKTLRHPAAKMSIYRVKLDLSSFYNDRRKYAYVLINPEWKFVKCLQQHVENLFNLSNIEFVTEDSCFFPPLESVSVINKEDTLKVVERQTVEDKINHYKEKKKKVKEQKEEDQTESTFERYLNCEHSSSSKKIKNKSDKIHPICSSTFGLGIVDDMTLTVKKLKDIFDKKVEETSYTMEQKFKDKGLISNSDDVESPNKPKRKRKRKKKLNRDIENVPAKNLKVDQTITKNVPTIIFHKSNSPGHIRFNEDGQSAVQSDNKPKSSVQFKNYLDALNNLKPRLVTPKVINNISNDDATQKETISDSPQVTKILPNMESYLKNVITSSDPENITENQKNDIMDIDHVADQHEFNGTTQAITKLNTLKSKDILSYAETFEGNPTEGDVLLFKIHRFRENEEESTMSDYICGKFEGIDESTKFLKIFLIDGQDQLQDPEGKILLGLQTDNLGYLYLKYEDLLDRKVLRM